MPSDPKPTAALIAELRARTPVVADLARVLARDLRVCFSRTESVPGNLAHDIGGLLEPADTLAEVIATFIDTALPDLLSRLEAQEAHEAVRETARRAALERAANHFDLMRIQSDIPDPAFNDPATWAANELRALATEMK